MVCSPRLQAAHKRWYRSTTTSTTTPAFLQNQGSRCNCIYKLVHYGDPTRSIQEQPNFSLCSLCTTEGGGVLDTVLEAMDGLPFRPQQAPWCINDTSSRAARRRGEVSPWGVFLFAPHPLLLSTLLTANIQAAAGIISPMDDYVFRAAASARLRDNSAAKLPKPPPFDPIEHLPRFRVCGHRRSKNYFAPLMYTCHRTHQLILSHHEIRRGAARDQMVRGREVEHVRLKAQSRSAKETPVSMAVSIYNLVSASDMGNLSSPPSHIRPGLS